MNIESHPFLPPVSVEDILFFNENDPSTFTVSALVNHYLTLYHRYPRITITHIAKMMDLDPAELKVALRIETGNSPTRP